MHPESEAEKPRVDLLAAPHLWEQAGLDTSLQASLRALVRREMELRESEAQLRDFVENASVGLHRVGPDGTILWANRAELELLGYSREEYVGRSIIEFHADRHVIDDILAKLARGETLQSYEARLRAKDGTLKHVLISSNVYTRGDEFVHTRCFTRDITPRREAEEALRRNREQVQLITDALPFLVAYVDAEHRYTFVNATYERWLARPRTELTGRTLEACLGEEAFATIRPHVERALAGHSLAYEAEVPYPDGITRSIEATYIPQFAEGGAVLGFVSLVADITERTSFERYRAVAVKRSERLLSITTAIANAVGTTEVLEAVVDQVAATMNASSAGLWLLHEDGKSARLERGLGYTDAVRATLQALPLEGAAAMPILDCLRSGRPVWLPSQDALLASYPHLRGTATPGRAYRIACLPLVAQGHMLGALGLTIEGRDAQTEDEKSFLVLVARYASQALQRLRLLEDERQSRARADALYRFAQVIMSADRIEQVLDAGMDVIESTLGTRRVAVLTYGDETTMRFRAWRHLSDGYRAAVEGHSPWSRDVVSPEPVLMSDVEADERVAALRSVLRGEGIRAVGFIPLVTRGRLLGKFMIYYEAPHLWGAQEVETAVAIANHLASVIARFAATTKLEDTIRQNEVFAGVLAHDLRNPLNAILMAAQAMLMQGEGEAAQEQARPKPLSRIVTSGRRMNRMIELLLDFTRARSGGGIQIERHPASMLDLCEQAISELELANPRWRIRCELHGDARGCWDTDRMLQVISNLVANAGQHGVAGSEIGVRIDGTDASFVSVTVHNEGVIPEATLPHLFNPFLGTSRRRGAAGGLGLGLFIVKELVVAHGGTVSVASSAEIGTAFTAKVTRDAP